MKVCTHWLKGHCAFGDKCRYDHVRPDWAPRQEAQVNGYKAPTVPKPETDNLEDVLPISKLRLSGHAATVPAARSNGTSHAANGSKTIPIATVMAEERRSPPPVDLPADPFGAGESSGADTEAARAAVAAESAALVALPEDLGLGSDIPLPGELTLGLEQYPEEQSAEAQYHGWVEVGAGGESDVYAAGVYHDGDVEGYAGDSAYDEAQEAYDQSAYAAAEYYNGNGNGYGSYPGGSGGGSAGAYGSYGEHGLYGMPGGASSSGGEFLPGSSGTSPNFRAWHIPGGGSDGGWGGVDISRFYANPALQSLCYEYYSTGACTQGEACQMAHGDLCDTCQHFALHPVDQRAREQHSTECRARHERLQARNRSIHVECGICLERVLEKVNGDRKFGLLDCEHAFCLSCIRQWRQNIASGADVESVRSRRYSFTLDWHSR